MSLILTFLGKGGTGRSTLAVATAKRLAAEGRRVLLAFQDAGPAPALLVGQDLTGTPTELEPSLWSLQFHSTNLLQQSWDELKALEQQYLRTPFLKAVYGQELGILPGMDSALALNALREFDAQGNYDVIVYDGPGDMQSLRMLGMPEILDWYLRRFQAVLQQSDLWKTVSPFVQPVTTAVLSVDISGDMFNRPEANQVRSILEEGREAVHDPNRVLGFLVTTSTPEAVATARYLWGSAQQIGLSVGGVLVTGEATEVEATDFAPLSIHSTPWRHNGDWQPVISALPEIYPLAHSAPRSLQIDQSAGTVRLFLPGFDKSQVTLTQYGPEVTIEAGDQRRNLFLPAALRGRPVKGAKFQDQHLTISFG